MLEDGVIGVLYARCAQVTPAISGVRDPSSVDRNGVLTQYKLH